MRKFIALVIVLITAGTGYHYYPQISETVKTALPNLSIPGSSSSSSELLILHLNVGQGDATLILDPQENGHRTSVLMDAGDIPNSGDPDGGAIVLDILQQYNITELDYFIASHYDADHIGGLIQKIQIKINLYTK